MRTGSLVDAILLLALAGAAAGCGMQPAAAPVAAPSMETSPAPAAGTRITVEGVAIPVAIDAAAIDAAQGNSVEVVARRGDRVLVIDGWASKPQGMSRCQAGRERWLRLIDLAGRRELFSKLVESCLHDVEPGNPVATWPDGSDTIRVDLLSEPGFTLSADGVVAR